MPPSQYLCPGESNESDLQCNVNFAVSGNAVTLADPLVVDNWVTCAAVHVVTFDDVENLERESTATVQAGDIFGYEVSASDAEVVVLDQVMSADCGAGKPFVDKKRASEMRSDVVVTI